MPDPLSVAGTAVGVASLGIRVCQSLVCYLRSASGRSQEIAEDLAEVQTLISIFYSLNDILPKVNQTQFKAAAIRRCLENSQDKLLELQKLLIELRGSQHSTGREKMKEAGRTLAYPFRENKLKLLRQSLRDLLHNLNLAIDITSLESQIAHHDKIETIGREIQDLDIQLKAANVGVQDLDLKMQENLKQLRSLESTITDTLDQITHRTSQTEQAIQDLNNTITEKLDMINTDTRSLVSGNLAMVEKLAKVEAKLDSQSARLSQMGIDVLRMQDQGSLSLIDPSQPVTHPASTPGASSRSISPIRDCRHQDRSPAFSFTFWNVQFEFQQRVPGKHSWSYKFFGVNGQTQKRIESEFTKKRGLLYAGMALVYATEYMKGKRNLGILVFCYKTVVPTYDPVYRGMLGTVYDIFSQSANEIIRLFECSEWGNFSLYRDGQASPRDGNGHDNSLAQLSTNVITAGFFHPGTSSEPVHGKGARDWVGNVAVAVAMRMLQDGHANSYTTLLSDGLMSTLPTFLFSNRGPKAKQSRRRGGEVVLCLATAEHLFPDIVIKGYLGHNTVNLLHSLPGVMNAMKLSPMMRATVSRSVVGLGPCISNNGRATTETVWGNTTRSMRDMAPWNANVAYDGGYGLCILLLLFWLCWVMFFGSRLSRVVPGRLLQLSRRSRVY